MGSSSFPGRFSFREELSQLSDKVTALLDMPLDTGTLAFGQIVLQPRRSVDGGDSKGHGNYFGKKAARDMSKENI